MSLEAAAAAPSAAAAAGQQQHHDKRGKKRKQRPAKPLLEQLPHVPAAAAAAVQQQRPPRRQPSQQQQPQDQQPDPAAASSLGNGNSKFARALGSTDYQTREQGLAALSRWLLHRPALSELDMLKLWRGIFFCFWHSDKEPVQEDLAARLAGLLPRMQPDMARLYWAAMLASLRAEWGSMDRHRVNKFLMLVRKFVAALLQRLAASNWDADAIRTFTGADLPCGQALLPLGQTKSLGLTYHLADVWLPELRRVAEGQPLPPDGLQALLQPFADVLQQSSEAPQVARVREAVFDALAQDVAAFAAAEAGLAAGGAGAGSSDSSDDDDDSDAWAYCAALDVQGYAEHLFSLGAQPGVRARNREALYALSKQLERVAAKRRRLEASSPAAELGGAGRQPRRQQQHTPNGAAAAAAANGHASPSDAGLSGSKRKKQKQHAGGTAEEAAAAPAATPASSSKKSRKQATPAAADQQPPQQQTPGSTAQKQQSGKKRQGDAADAAATTTPGSAGGGGPASSAGKRQVTINLQRNLYHQHGAPPPAAEVRTPPRAKPKSALKPISKFEKKGGGSSGGSPRGSKQPSGGKSGGGGCGRVTPGSVPRVRAAAFF